MSRRKQFVWQNKYLFWWRGESEHLSPQNWTGMYWCATAKEICDFAHGHLLLLANASVHPAMPRTLVTCTVHDDWSVIGGRSKPITPQGVYRKFKKSPSGCLLLSGQAHIQKDWSASVHGRIYGQAEVAAYLESPEMKELAKIMGTIGAQGAESAGIFVEADNG